MGQITNLLSERAPRTFPSDTKKNPKETIKVVSLRSGKALTDPVVKVKPEVVNKETETPTEKTSEEQNGQSSGVQKEIEESRHMPALPLPQKMKREKLDKCFGRLLEMLKQLYVNIPFTDLLTQMPAYVKLLKEILSSKRNLEKTTVIKLNAHYSAILQNKIPQSMGTQEASPYHARWGVRNLTRPSASLTSILREGIVEDIIVRVDKFVFPVDFIVVDMEVNKEVPLFLRRPFLCTCRSILDIYEGKLMLRVGNEKVVFQMKRMMKYPSGEASAYSCFKLDVVGELAKKYKFDKLVGDTLERCTQEQKLVELLKKHKKAIG
ncbi:uncharacterized protein [Nicotiana sylvestris]|uniref:uncharacterized protein n=1 Tax=Nicotiana sylvestris TaxID=4096 RepID=UPI00388CAB8B